MLGVAWRGVVFGLGLAGAVVVGSACGVLAPDSGSVADVEPAFGGETFDDPVELVAEPGGTFLIAEKPGRVLRLGTSSGSEPEEVLDFTDRVVINHREQGLLSLALDPAFQVNGRVWLYYSLDEPARTALAHLEMTGDGQLDPSTETIVLEFEQPYRNHNGGAIRFGPDGMLYLGLGDGGDAWDPEGNGQDRSSLLGSMIRIDVSGDASDAGYSIPPDNPFVDDPGARPEIWAYGLRNPWRMSFDPATDDLWVGDVGQDSAEEVNVVEAGGNYGWNLVEGFECVDPPCPDNVYQEPRHAYGHDAGCAITGGVVYRGEALTELQGHYLFGDLCSGTVWSYTEQAGAEAIATVDGPVVSFATGHDGEVYVVRFGGPVLRIVSP